MEVQAGIECGAFGMVVDGTFQLEGGEIGSEKQEIGLGIGAEDIGAGFGEGGIADKDLVWEVEAVATNIDGIGGAVGVDSREDGDGIAVIPCIDDFGG